MSRTNKKSRIKGLPPKIQLQILDSRLGVRPTKNILTSSSSSYYNDLNTVNFVSSVINVGSQVSTTILSSTIYNNFGEDISSSLYVQGNLNKTNTQNFFVTPNIDDSSPFIESNHYDDKTLSNNEFFLTGSKVSDIGVGFSSPLWAKTKIEIDLTPADTHSFFIENFTSSSRNHPMAYWNNDAKLWQGIGNGREFAHYTIPTITSGNFNKFMEEQCIGFGPGLPHGTPGFDREYAHPITNFGFPEHIKFHATSSNTIHMKNYINKPFLLEKIVLQISCSLLINNFSLPLEARQTITSFFILNQKNNGNLVKIEKTKKIIQYFAPFYSDESELTIKIPSSSNEIYNNTIIKSTRDLVTFHQIASFNLQTYSGSDNSFFKNRDYIIDAPLWASWSNNINMSGTVKVGFPSAYDGFIPFALGGDDVDDNPRVSLIAAKSNSGRNNSLNINSRDYINSIASPVPTFIQVGVVTTVAGIASRDKNNPYMLFPNDEIVLGFQLPLFEGGLNDNYALATNQGKGHELSFAKYPGKITLYGSYITENKEYHDTLVQSLSSNNISTIIGDD